MPPAVDEAPRRRAVGFLDEPRRPVDARRAGARAAHRSRYSRTRFPALVGGMPKVTRQSSVSAISNARRTQRRNCATSSMVWSAGNTAIAAPGSRRAMCAAASARHAAVPRAARLDEQVPRGSAGSWRRTSARVLGRRHDARCARGTTPRNRCAVACSSVSRPVDRQELLRTPARLCGQKRVPAPPAMITA